MNTTISNKVLRKDFPFQAKSLDEDLGTFEGFASTWHLDLQKDRITPGAFARTLAEAKADRERRGGQFLFPLLWMHNVYEPIGALYEATETSKGLFVRGLIDMDVPEGRRAFSALKKGYLTGFSIGYKSRRDHMEAGGVRVLEQVDLLEVSIVSFPANPEAVITGVKSAEEAWLDNIVADMRRTAASHGAQKRERNVVNNKPLWLESGQARSEGGHIEYGLPHENRDLFEQALRRQAREDDSLYELTPGSKAFQREVERRKQEREKKQAEQKAALEQERRERAEYQAAMSQDSYTPRSYAEAAGFDPQWTQAWFEKWANSGRVTPIDADKLILSRGDIQRMARIDFEEVTFQAIKARNKRLQERGK